MVNTFRDTSLWIYVDYWAHLGLGNLGLGEGGEQLLDHLKLSHLHGVPVLLHLDVNAGKTELLLLEGVEDVVGDDAPHPVELPGQLQLLDKGAAHNGSGGSADASLQGWDAKLSWMQSSDPPNLPKILLEVHLAVEDDWAGGGGVLQHGNDLVEVLLGGSLRQ